jgi:predicted lysophospholipase L1 biosynthesis ABC-type transport system permease subunit
MARWAHDLGLGLRLACSGGRDGWIRTALTAVGVGIGVTMLLAAASLPSMQHARRDRLNARDAAFIASGQLAPGPNTMMVKLVGTTVRGIDVRGVLVKPDGPTPPTPPGVSALPPAGAMVVSPALAELLSSPAGDLLKPRLPYRMVGRIDAAGLTGPGEYAFYAGDSRLTDDVTAQGSAVSGTRIDHFGVRPEASALLAPILLLLTLVIVVVLLVPIAIFVGAAIRFGDERRDRRLAAIRLLGADAAMTRRIAAGEALLAAALGVAVGAVGFIAGRPFVDRFGVASLSFYPADVRPSALVAALIAVGVPAAAVVVTQLALRRVIIEPLGVVRRAIATKSRRLWWRILLPLAGAAMLLAAASSTSLNAPLVSAVMILTLVGVATLLPWLVPAAVRGLGGGGRLPWQLAVRRLQAHSASSSRVVNGVAVAAAGAIVLQMLFVAAGALSTTSTGVDVTRTQADAGGTPTAGLDAGAVRSRFAATDGVRHAYAVTVYDAMLGENTVAVQVADCPTLRAMAGVERCGDGDIFLASRPHDTDPLPFRPGQRLAVGAVRWTLPADTAQIVMNGDELLPGILATPAALPRSITAPSTVTAYLSVDPTRPDAADHIRNTAFAVGLEPRFLTTTEVSVSFQSIERWLTVAVIVVLLLIGLSLLVSTVEQLLQQRKLLAALVAVGARRSTLSWSVFWQTAIPMTLGVALACLAGLSVGALILTVAGQPVRVGWAGVSAILAGAGAVTLLATALSLPVLWRMLRPEGLRAE